ncbi:unnamed protein product [Trichobilharzia szidati]|nr:unnamed protein product [Trichobilharzia szidati]
MSARHLQQGFIAYYSSSKSDFTSVLQLLRLLSLEHCSNGGISTRRFGGIFNASESVPRQMEVYMVVRRKKTNIHLNAKETSLVLEVKKMIEGILKVKPEDQLLLKHQTEMEDEKTLSYYNLNSQTARAHTPATLGLCLRDPAIF